MSYVEKAFWDYLKSTLFGGVRILLSRQFILFSVILFTISVATTGLVVMQEQASELITQKLINDAFSLEISLAIGFILSGLVAKRLNFVTRLILMFLIVIIVFALSGLSTDNVLLSDFTEFFIEVVPLLAFFCWSFLIPVASFAFAKGLFSNKVTGSILFLGKPKTERKSIFSGLLTLVAVFFIIGNTLMIYVGMMDSRTSYVILGILAVVISVLVLLVVQGFLFSDDIFNSVLGLFFIMILPNQIMIVLTSISGSANIVTTFDFVLVAFTLLYSAQGISRRINIKGVTVDKSGQLSNIKSDDPFRIGRFVGFVGGEGIVLIYLGLALGFHLIQLQILNGTAGIYEELFAELSFSEAYHDITSIFSFLIFGIVTLTYFLQRGRGYWDADIIRLDFLPPYDDLKDYMERVKTGEISKTELAITIGKKVGKGAVNAGSAGIFSAARMFRDKIFKDSDKKE
ncbi:MAG: hypothetical protein ACW98I_06395 [Candidatus Hodarchaeales archaeon]|jgi:hypothetical protein